MIAYLWIKWAHVVSSTILFGTGIGIAYFFVRANATRDARVIAAVAADVVRADLLFTATAVVVQPVTGFAMMWLTGLSLDAAWLRWSLILYSLAGCCWLPVIWLQVRLRNLARLAAAEGLPLPAIYRPLYRWWLALGVPAFLAVLVIFHLMIRKPVA